MRATGIAIWLKNTGPPLSADARDVGRAQGALLQFSHIAIPVAREARSYMKCFPSLTNE
ncbi:hypothetical protein GCM10009552_19720 [Rothia nasimurium]